jgi:ABC-type uncharacterized transport system substrate-binding protein
MQQAARGKLLIHWVHIAALADSNRTSPPQLLSIQNAARARGIECCVHQIEKSEEIAAAIEAAKGSGAAALTF